jgi:hypothetical protein
VWLEGERTFVPSSHLHQKNHLTIPGVFHAYIPALSVVVARNKLISEIRDLLIIIPSEVLHAYRARSLSRSCDKQKIGLDFFFRYIVPTDRVFETRMCNIRVCHQQIEMLKGEVGQSDQPRRAAERASEDELKDSGGIPAILYHAEDAAPYSLSIDASTVLPKGRLFVEWKLVRVRLHVQRRLEAVSLAYLCCKNGPDLQGRQDHERNDS